MFQRVIDDFKDSTSRALRQAMLVAIAAFALLITLAFLCAAAFVFLRDSYGAIEACLIGAAAFLVVAAIAASAYAVAKNQAKNQARARAAQRTRSPLQTALADPALIATGVQVIRAVGLKRLVPIVAVAGLAFGVLAANRRPSDDVPLT
jgi:membrane associated rhomboid family serine protease